MSPSRAKPRLAAAYGIWQPRHQLCQPLIQHTSLRRAAATLKSSGGRTSAPPTVHDMPMTCRSALQSPAAARSLTDVSFSPAGFTCTGHHGTAHSHRAGIFWIRQSPQGRQWVDMWVKSPKGRSSQVLMNRMIFGQHSTGDKTLGFATKGDNRTIHPAAMPNITVALLSAAMFGNYYTFHVNRLSEVRGPPGPRLPGAMSTFKIFCFSLGGGLPVSCGPGAGVAHRQAVGCQARGAFRGRVTPNGARALHPPCLVACVCAWGDGPPGWSMGDGERSGCQLARHHATLPNAQNLYSSFPPASGGLTVSPPLHPSPPVPGRPLLPPILTRPDLTSS